MVLNDASHTHPQTSEGMARQAGQDRPGIRPRARLDPFTCYQVLSGVKKGTRGESHRAAVLLGIKEGVVEVPEEYGRRATDIGAVISK